MPLPEARPGLVIRYEYLWRRQALAGQNSASKERPACIVVAITTSAAERRVLIVPITTQPPLPGITAVELPSAVQRHLGLDAEKPSWVILSEANLDVWPSPDIRQVPGQPGRFAYGVLPLRLTNTIRRAVMDAIADCQLPTVNREEK